MCDGDLAYMFLCNAMEKFQLKEIQMNLCLNILGILSILGVACLSIILIISYFENRKLLVTKYSINDNRIPDNFRGFHIVQLSDLHNASFDEANSKLYGVINELAPDIIVITGDMIIGKPGMDVIQVVEFMNSLCKIAPVYFSMGNHELRVSLYADTYGNMWKVFMEHISPDVHLLFDETADIIRGDEKISLYGLNLTPELYKRFKHTPMPENYLSELFGTCNRKNYHIFMAHNPDYFPDYVKWGANLTFSGHVHGGMIRIPWLGGALSPMIHFFPKYDKGVFQIGEQYMVLSGGLGNHTFKFRVNNLPEVVSVTLNADEM